MRKEEKERGRKEKRAKSVYFYLFITSFPPRHARVPRERRGEERRRGERGSRPIRKTPSI